MSDLVKRLRIKAGMIEMGELIAWGSDVALMREAADALEMAAPAVQGEAVAWQLRTQDVRLLRCAANSLRGYALELMLSHTLENGEWPDGEEDAKAHHDHLMALAKGLEELQAARTAPQPAEQQPAPDVRAWWRRWMQC